MKFFGSLFDFNGDGKLDAFEKAAEFGAFMLMIESEKNESTSSAEFDLPKDDDGCNFFGENKRLWM